MLTRGLSCALLLIGLTARSIAAPPTDGSPYLDRSGPSARLMVDGRPFLILGGELSNSSTSSIDSMKAIWPRMAADAFNTLLTPVSWEQVEPQEGQFDFSLVDSAIAGAQQNGLHLVFLWFGSWKNGISSYDPGWVKSDLRRFPRAQDEKGRNLEILSTFSNANRDADAHAFAALMQHIRRVDSKHTVLMMQVENESGVLGPARDHSAAADAAWQRPVPDALLRFLVKNRAALEPEFLEVWGRNGYKSEGTWAEVFGTSRRAEEIFEAWQYSQYIDAVAAAGKAEYAIPMYVNAWITQYSGEPGGEHPSGGAISRVLDVWLASVSHIDVVSPDIYLPDLGGVLASYNHLGNPLFIPETRGGAAGGANALYAFGQGVFGFSPFAVDRGDDDPLSAAYRALGQIAPLLTGLDRSKIASVVRQAGDSEAAVELGGYLVHIQYQAGGRSVAGVPTAAANGATAVPVGGVLLLNTAPDEFVVVGEGVTVTFLPDSNGPPQSSILSVEAGGFEEGRWVAGRRLNGDETNSDSELIFRGSAPSIQRVHLYRHD